MKFFKKDVYSHLPSSENESFSSKSEEDFSQVSSKKGRILCLSNPIVTLLLGILSCTFVVVVVVVAILAWESSDDKCTRQLSVWSPALEAVKYKETTLHNKFDEPSIYRGPPSPEREQAWLDLWDHAAISIPESKLRLLNKSSSTQTFRHLPSSLGGGISGLPDVFHQLHCLDTIRQYTWLLAGNYGSSPTTVAGEPKQHPLIPIPPAFDGTSDVANRMHADHCIETLRKTLMCHADVTPLLILRDDNNPIGDRPDFNLHQKCRDWDAVREWTTRNWVTGREG